MEQRLFTSPIRNLPTGAFIIKKPTLLFFGVFLITLVCVYSDQASMSRGCLACYNGGTQQLPPRIFGYCTCVCRDGYTGPQCQFSIVKRSPFPTDLRLKNNMYKNYMSQKLLGTLKDINSFNKRVKEIPAGYGSFNMEQI